MGAQRRQGPQLEGWTLRGGGAGCREGAFEQISAGVEGSAEESNSGAGGAPWRDHLPLSHRILWILPALQLISVEGCGHGFWFKLSRHHTGPWTIPLPVPFMFLLCFLSHLCWFSSPALLISSLPLFSFLLSTNSSIQQIFLQGLQGTRHSRRVGSFSESKDSDVYILADKGKEA